MLGLANNDLASNAPSDDELVKGLDWLIAKQNADGSIPIDRPEAPLLQGQFMTAVDALAAFDWAAAHATDAKYKTAETRLLGWVAGAAPDTTQDKVFKILALTSYGTADQKALAQPVVDELKTEQQPDGGWKETAKMQASNALATGEVLYAFKRAGVSIESPAFGRGVIYLLRHQKNTTDNVDGSWPLAASQAGRPSNFAATMWPVIALAGSYGVSRTGAVYVDAKLPHADRPTRNLEIVLDVSGSMNSRLGKSTRWNTALDVLKQVLAQLPDDFNVGLRVYGHRYPSTSRQSCTDTEQIVPMAKIDRDRILGAASAQKPRGETPLVYSVLQTVNDLRGSGGGSVIVITDGEESCHGNMTAAAQQLKDSGVDVNLNIVGFTLTGKTAKAQLGAFAGSTGGRYYTATDGDQLSRALMLASLQTIPYDVVDAAGHTVVSAQTGDAQSELTPGDYHVKIHAPGQEFDVPVRVDADHVSRMTVALQDGHFVIQR